MVLIGGEAGIGKSRLLRAFREELGDELHATRSHFCSPYHSNSALHPIIAQLERAAGSIGDQAADKLAKLEALLAQATISRRRRCPDRAAAEVPVGQRSAALNLSPQRQKQRTLESLIDQLACLAHTGQSSSYTRTCIGSIRPPWNYSTLWSSGFALYPFWWC